MKRRPTNEPIWVAGAGPWRTVSHCPPGTTVVRYKTLAQAEHAEAFLARVRCGHRCEGARGHELIGGLAAVA